MLRWAYPLSAAETARARRVVVGDRPAMGGAKVVQLGIVRLIRELAADTVVTFGPDGVTGHTDYRAVSRWTTHQAWAVSGARGRLLQATVSAGFATLPRRA
jgi:LmbE family N-acetylglucosaminyl deacetylase